MRERLYLFKLSMVVAFGYALRLSTGCLSGLLFRIEERVRTKASIFFSYHQDLLLTNLVHKQWLFTTFDNTWMDINPNQKGDSENEAITKRRVVALFYGG